MTYACHKHYLLWCKLYLDLEPSILGAVADVTCGREVHPTTNTGTVDGRDHWLVALMTAMLVKQSLSRSYTFKNKLYIMHAHKTASSF